MILAFGVLERPGGPEVLLLTTGMVLVAQPNLGNIRQMKDDVQWVPSLQLVDCILPYTTALDRLMCSNRRFAKQ